jgi:hypothetical protein
MNMAEPLLSTDAFPTEMLDANVDTSASVDENILTGKSLSVGSYTIFHKSYLELDCDLETDDDVVVDLAAFREQNTSREGKSITIRETSLEVELRRFARGQLAGLRGMCENWDGHGAMPPDLKILDAASFLIDKWDWSTNIAPEIGALSDGAVCFEFYDVDDNLLGALDIVSEDLATYAFVADAEESMIGQLKLNEPSQRLQFFDLLKKAKALRE